ncbi:MAG: hypothetical protein MJZ43_04665 [Bacteroidaceae bacterium]|nr:hypothetical protein [Bacteroidaceae bacterium]
MKKYILLIFVTLLNSCACNTIQESQAQKNARQFVKENTSINPDNIKQIKVSEPDTLISDIVLSFENNAFLKTQFEYLSGNVSRDSLDRAISSFQSAISDVEFASTTGITKELKEKYDGALRCCYKVSVIMKSGTTKEFSVIMDADNETPYKFLHIFINDLYKYEEAIHNAI